MRVLQVESGDDVKILLHQIRDTEVDADLDARSVTTCKSLHGLSLKKKQKRQLRRAVWSKSMLAKVTLT